MAIRQHINDPEPRIQISPPIDESGWERLRSLPGVIYRRRVDGCTPRWTPAFEVVEGFDIWAVVEQDEDDDIVHSLGVGTSEHRG